LNTQTASILNALLFLVKKYQTKGLLNVLKKSYKNKKVIAKFNSYLGNEEYFDILSVNKIIMNNNEKA